MKKFMARFVPLVLTMGLILLCAMPAMAGDKHQHHRNRVANADHTLFDGTNPANQPNSGAVCGAYRIEHGVPILTDEPFTWHVSVSNFSASEALVRIINQDGDFTHYKVPANSSFSLSQAGGGEDNQAFRVWVETDGQLAGEASIRGRGVFCISCDADSAGDAACDQIIPNP